MSDAPSISVVVACHDETQEFVRECLQSLLDQSFRDWECILVDDGSHHETASSVLAEMQDPRFRLIRHETNRGLGAARNTGIREANASLIALLDADDRLNPRFLELTYRALSEQPDVDWVVVDWQCFGTTNDVWPFPMDDSVNCPAHFLFVGSGTLMRRSAWAAIGGYSEEFTLRGGEDWDFWLGVAERGLRPAYLPQPLYQYRTHPQAMTFTSARLSNYKFRQAIYQRHRSAFLFMGLNCPHCSTPRSRAAKFLAQGLAVSSNAYLDQGRRLIGIGLAARALLLQPANRAYGRHFLRSLLPNSVRRLVRRFRS